MIAVIFETWPADDRRGQYLDIAAGLKAELERVPGFVSVERFESLADPGKLLSLSFWQNEAAVAAWRRAPHHRGAQAQGRSGVFTDYRIRVAGVVRDYTLTDRIQAPGDSLRAHGDQDVEAEIDARLDAGAGAAANSQERNWRLLGEAGEPSLHVARRPGDGPAVLFVHGATFPSDLSIGWKIDGRSWSDDLAARGFDVWSFDLAGYGRSERPAAMRSVTSRPFGRSDEAAAQIRRVVEHMDAEGVEAFAMLAHSWGCMPASAFAAAHPEAVHRLVLFGPIARRSGSHEIPALPPSYAVTIEDQWKAFLDGIPDDEPAPLDAGEFRRWASAYLESDPLGVGEAERAVMVPSGPKVDIAEAWSGRLCYDPKSVLARTLIIRGEWDAVCSDDDAQWLARNMSNAVGGAQAVTLPRGGHRMHLETGRLALFDCVADFLGADRGRSA